MSAREEILARVRASLGRDGPDAAARKKLENGLLHRMPAVVPARAGGSAAELAARFAEMAARAGATVARCADARELARDIADFLAAEDLPREIRMAPDRALDVIALSTQTGFSVTRGGASGETRVGLSPALAGVAETGSVMLASSPAHPMSLAFLPDAHIVILPRSRIAGSYEAALAMFSASGRHELPRAVTFITGPSRSADIEQKIQYGAHGPRRLHIIVVESLP